MFDETDYDRESERDRVPDPAAKKIVGCQFKENNKTCGETHTLQIIKEFKALYEDRLKKIATEGGEESYQAKLRLQNDWIRDLTEQNEMLVRVVGELEHEATERVAMLEKKLKASAKNGLEKQEEVKTLQTSVNEVKKEVCWAHHKCEEYMKLSDEYQMKHQQSLEIIESHTQEKKELEKKCEKFNCMLAKLQQEMDAVLEEFESYKQYYPSTVKAVEWTIQDENFEDIVQDLESLRYDHKCFLDQVCVLNCQNQNQHVAIDALQTALKDTEVRILTTRSMSVAMQRRPSESDTSAETGTSTESTCSYQNSKLQEVEGLHDVVIELKNSLTRIVDCPKNTESTGGISNSENEQLALTLRDKDQDVEKARKNHDQEVCNLKQTIKELETALANSDDKLDNYQKAQCTCALKNEIKKLKKERQQYETVIEYLQKEMVMLTHQLHKLQQLLNVANAAPDSNPYLQEENESLQLELCAAQQQLLKAHKLNQVNSIHISKLQTVLGQKNAEVNNLQNVAQHFKKQLTCSVCRCKNLDATVAELQGTIIELNLTLKQYEHESVISEECSDICHKEVDICRNRLCGFRDKLLNMKQELQQGNQGFLQLKNVYDVNYTKLVEAEKTKAHYQEDLADLKHTVQRLNNKLTRTENDYRRVNEEYKLSQMRLLEVTQRDKDRQDEYLKYEAKLKDDLRDAQDEQVRLAEYSGQLQAELNNTTLQLADKEQKLQEAQENTSKFKGAKVAGDELLSVKDELNQMMQLDIKLKAENEKLRVQIASMQQNNQFASQQLGQCLAQLQGMQLEKDTLAEKNEHLTRELISIQNAFKNLNRIYKSKTDAMIDLEMERGDTKSNSDDLCSESCNVVDNVRAWMQEQRLINAQLGEKLREQCEIINKLHYQNQSLQAHVHASEMENRKSKLPPRQRGGSNSPDQFQQHHQKQEWNLGSHGSGSISPSSSQGSSQGWCTYVESDDAADGTNQPVWLHQFQSMTEECKRSNKYWKNKMDEFDYLVTRDQ